MSVILLVADGTGFGHYSVAFQNPKVREVFKRFPYTMLVNTSNTQEEQQKPRKKTSKKQKKGTKTSKKKKKSTKKKKISTKRKYLSTGKLQPVTESAASATAMATGKWVPHTRISTDADGTPIETITETLKRKKPKMEFGIVCTTDFVDATPAAFFSHAKFRKQKDIIAQQMLQYSLDVLMSGGKVLKNLQKYKYMQKHLKKNFEVIEQVRYPKVKDFSNVGRKLEKALGQFKNDFFLLVEESLIDVASHKQDLARMAKELTSFCFTVETALNYVEKKENKTTLIVVSDHATGGAVIKNNLANTTSHFEFTSGNHDGHIVPMFLAGHKSRKVINHFKTGLVDMVDIHKILKFLYNVK